MTTPLNLATASLCAAAYAGDLDAMREQLDAGADINGTTTNNAGEALTPLMWASAGGRIEAIYFLLTRGASVGYTDPQTGTTALHFAAMASQPEAVAVLMAHGVDRQMGITSPPEVREPLGRFWYGETLEATAERIGGEFGAEALALLMTLDGSGCIHEEDEDDDQ